MQSIDDCHGFLVRVRGVFDGRLLLFRCIGVHEVKQAPGFAVPNHDLVVHTDHLLCGSSCGSRERAWSVMNRFLLPLGGWSEDFAAVTFVTGTFGVRFLSMTAPADGFCVEGSAGADKARAVRLELGAPMVAL